MATHIEHDLRHSLRCMAGWHRAQAVVHWNHGYYFSHCRRCGLDLIRTAYGRWQVPKGYRVVWSQERPPTAVGGDVTLHPAAEEEQTRSELPIQEVLRRLNGSQVEDVPSVPYEGAAPTEIEESAEEEKGKGQPKDEQPPTVAFMTSVFPDFMEDNRGLEAAPSFHGSDRLSAHPDEPRRPNRLGNATRGLGQAIGRAALALRVQARRWTNPREIWLEAAMIVTLLTGTSAILFALARHEPAQPVQPAAESTHPQKPTRQSVLPIGSGSQKASSPTLLPPAQPAFVAARLLNCRDAPSLQARTVRRLERGVAVDIYAVEQGWANIAHRRGQCWALADYLSIEAPL